MTPYIIANFIDIRRHDAVHHRDDGERDALLRPLLLHAARAGPAMVRQQASFRRGTFWRLFMTLISPLLGDDGHSGLSGQDLEDERPCRRQGHRPQVRLRGLSLDRVQVATAHLQGLHEYPPVKELCADSQRDDRAHQGSVPSVTRRHI